MKPVKVRISFLWMERKGDRCDVSGFGGQCRITAKISAHPIG